MSEHASCALSDAAACLCCSLDYCLAAIPSRADTGSQMPPSCRSVLDELRIQWEKKLKETGAMEPEPAPEPPRWVVCLHLHVLPKHMSLPCTAWLQILVRSIV